MYTSLYGFSSLGHFAFQFTHRFWLRLVGVLTTSSGVTGLEICLLGVKGLHLAS